MFVKVKNVRASNTSPGKASSALKSHLKYLQYRERDPEKETKDDRQFFSRDQDHVDRREVHDQVIAEERKGDIYYHRMVLSPSKEERVTDWQDWTRKVIGDLEQKLGTRLEWDAMHHNNTDNPHVHVVLRGTGHDTRSGNAKRVELTPEHFTRMKESGRAHSEYEHDRLVRETLHDLDQRDHQEWQQPAREAERTYHR